MTKSILALGSNLRCPERQLHQAIKKLRRLPKTSLIQVAPFYKNKAWGRKAQPNFCNTVVAIKTSLSAFDLLKACQSIEQKQQRVRKVKNGSRTLDIDIIFHGTVRMRTAVLTIPHPRFEQRDFVMLPLSSIKRSGLPQSCQVLQASPQHLNSALKEYCKI